MKSVVAFPRYIEQPPRKSPVLPAEIFLFFFTFLSFANYHSYYVLVLSFLYVF